MGRFVRGALLVVVLFAWCAGSALAAGSPFERPASAERELVSERTAESRTWEMPSGRRVTQIASRPVQWRDAGGVWRDYDLSLRGKGGGRGWGAQAGGLTIDLPAALGRSGGGSVRVADEAGNAVSMVFLGDVAAEGAVAGEVASYRGVADGVDVRLRAIPEGLKEDVVLRGPDASREVAYRLTVGSEDLGVEEDDAGGLLVKRGKEVVFVVPAPSLLDDEGRMGFGGRFELRKDGERSWVVRTVLPGRWLDASDRAWPVVVDPTITREATASEDCQRATIRVNPSSTLGPYVVCVPDPWRAVGRLEPGAWTDGYQIDNWLLRFATLTFDQGDAIDGATLRFMRGSNTSRPPPGAIEVMRIKSQWTAGSPAGSSDIDLAPMAQVPVSPEWQPVATDLTDLVTQWRRHQQTGGAAGVPNYGISLRMQINDEAARQPAPECGVTVNCPITVFPSSTHATTSWQPVLEVTELPGRRRWQRDHRRRARDELTGRLVLLQASAVESSVDVVRFQYIAGSQRRWTDIPLAALKHAVARRHCESRHPGHRPLRGPESELLVWDLTATTGGEVDGPVHVRAWLESPGAHGNGGMTIQSTSGSIAGGRQVALGPDRPGELNLLSGEFTTTAVDASVEAFLQNLTLSRTYRSRGVAVRNADMFGAGWDSSVNPDGGELPYKGIYNYSEVKEECRRPPVPRSRRDWNWERFRRRSTSRSGADIESFQEIERYGYEYAGRGGRRRIEDDVHAGHEPRGEVTGWSPTTSTRLQAGAYEHRHRRALRDHAVTDPSGASRVPIGGGEVAELPADELPAGRQPEALSYTYEAAGTRQRLMMCRPRTRPGASSISLVFGCGRPDRMPRVTEVAFQFGNETRRAACDLRVRRQRATVQATDPRVAGGVRKVRYAYGTGGRLIRSRRRARRAGVWLIRESQATTAATWRVFRAQPGGGVSSSTIRYGVPLPGQRRRMT